MSPTSEVLNRVEQLAAESGLIGEHNLLRGEFVILFDLPDDRTQEVFVCDSSQTSEIKVISVRSTCLVLDKAKLPSDKSMSMELLLTNEQLRFARYGVQEDDERYIVVASHDLFLDELGPRTLAVALECVALAADAYEAKFGLDIF